MRRLSASLPLLVAACLLSSCSRSTESAKKAESAEPTRATEAPKADAGAQGAAGTYRVRFDTSAGPFVVEVHRDWAPIGAARFEELVKDKFYDGARFFRVVENFVVQFGIASRPAMTKKWNKEIPDDPVKTINRTGTLAFATMGPNTRTAQIFINLRTNQSLDGRGFAPFAMVVEGMENVEKIYKGYGEAPDQSRIEKQGNTYLTAHFPKLDYIRTARIQ